MSSGISFSTALSIAGIPCPTYMKWEIGKLRGELGTEKGRKVCVGGGYGEKRNE